MTIFQHSIAVAGLVVAGLLFPGATEMRGATPPAPAMVAYKTRTCGCCGKWVEHLQENGFDVTVHSVDNLTPVRAKYGVPRDLRSCHTAEVGGYVVEGHIPAEDIHRLLKESPEAKGIAVPGMPIGSPGMEQGSRQDPYAVILFGEDGARSVFATH